MASTKENTFRTFTPAQSSDYAQHRRDYHPSLYQAIIGHHTATGGQLGTVVDVGCGPGTATRSLAAHFDAAVGLDQGESMIATARSLGGTTASSSAVRFEVSSAESLGADLAGGDAVRDGSVDLVTAATAAHWFDMAGFWGAAARVLRPGGTVAVWASGGPQANAATTPMAAEVQAAVRRMMESLGAYVADGNQLVHDLYMGLPLPWEVEPAVAEFDEASFVRREWGTGAEGSLPATQFLASSPPASLDAMEKVLGTTSPVIRWREAHPELAGTERDCVRVMRREIEQLLHEAGVEPGQERLQGGVTGVLLMVKKKA